MAYGALQESGKDFVCPFETTGLRDTLYWLEVDHGIIKMTLDAANQINQSPALCTAAEIASYLLFRSPRREQVPAADFPLPQLRFFYVPVFIAAVPELLSRHNAQSIPANLTKLLLQDIELWIHEHRARYAEWGFSETKWLRHHFWGDLFQIGRLQFQFHVSDLPVRAYRVNDGSGIITVVDGVHAVRSDGQFADADLSSHFPGPSDEIAPAFTTVFAEDDDIVYANPIEPPGIIAPKTIRIDLHTVSPVLAPDNPILAVHIPGGDALSPVAVTDSFAKARTFFTRYFPAYRPCAFTCDSWLLDPQLGDYLQPDSNILTFQRMFSVVPLPRANDHQHFERIFHVPIDRITDQSRDTLLKRAVFEHVEKGKSWRVAGGFISYDE